jgi:hypothetical protein
MFQRKSSLLINEGDARFTTGRERFEGAATEIETEGLACQFTEGNSRDTLALGFHS